MQFFMYEGFITDETWAEKNEDIRFRRENARKIAGKTNMFNNKLNNRAFFFVADATSDVIAVGIINRNLPNLEDRLKEYMDAIGIKIKDEVFDEILFNTLKNMLRSANSRDYIFDDDEILELFELNNLIDHTWRFQFGENLISKTTKKRVYEEAEQFLASDYLITEMDRIYAGTAKKKALGHPVHYLVQSDNHDSRKNMYRLLLKALYDNGRLMNRRYVYMDFEPSDKVSACEYEYLYKSCIGGTVVIRYNFKNSTEDEYADSGREIISKLCGFAKRYSGQVLTIFCLPRECTSTLDIFYENLGNITLVPIKEDTASGDRAKAYLKMLAKKNGIRTDKKLFNRLEDGMSYLVTELQEIFDLWYNDKLKTGIYPQYKELTSVKREMIKAAPKGTAFDELSEMIGLAEAKKVINNALNYYKAQKLFAEKGMKSDHPAMHMVFTGNPGTAKTSVARLFARILRENEIMSKGHLIEVGRSDLVGKYVGWTAPTIKNKFSEAEGGVLFIDEAYSLVDDRSGSFGDEAINTICQEMENHRENVVVIFAGYPDKMEEFLNKNPGLRSRIAFHVPFEDYNTEELCGIAGLIAKKKGLELTDGALEKLGSVFDHARETSDFGNGRYVRNAIEKARMAQATRLLAMDFDSIGKKDIVTICADDIEMPLENKNRVKKIGFCA